jgi:SAM-dependent methyltransferase
MKKSDSSLAAAFDIAAAIALEASQLLLASKEKDHNYLGVDVDPSTLRLIEKVVYRKERPAGLSDYDVAQLNELVFWRGVAYEGHMSHDPRAFKWFWNIRMVRSYLATGWTLDELQTADVVEIGCGPLGMIEFLPARKKAGYDPLNCHYAKLFANVRKADVEYYCDLKDLCQANPGGFDLAICFNVLDHTDRPRELFTAYMALLKPGGRFLFQVNTVHPGGPRSPDHGRMHPSPLTIEKVRSWLDEYSEGYDTHVETRPTREHEYPFMAWGRKKDVGD